MSFFFREKVEKKWLDFYIYDICHQTVAKAQTRTGHRLTAILCGLAERQRKLDTSIADNLYILTLDFKDFVKPQKAYKRKCVCSVKESSCTATTPERLYLS